MCRSPCAPGQPFPQLLTAACCKGGQTSTPGAVLASNTHDVLVPPCAWTLKQQTNAVLILLHAWGTHPPQLLPAVKVVKPEPRRLTCLQTTIFC